MLGYFNIFIVKTNIKDALKLALLLLCVVLCACVSSQKNNSSMMSGLLLSEPEEVNARSQLAIAHYTNTLFQVKMTKLERAEILFQRGIAYDSMGLSSLARMDYSEALKLNPSLAEAYNSIGVHYIQAGLYTRAYEAFDSTLEIEPSYEYALLNRGIALYYGGREQLASQDTLVYLTKDESDPIRWLWHYIAVASIDDEALKAQSVSKLVEAREHLSNDNWATSIADYYLGNITETDVIARLVSDVSNSSELNYRLCEAYFYLGKNHARNGNFNKAENYFKLSLSTNVYEYVEHKYARIELSNLRQSRFKTSQTN